MPAWVTAVLSAAAVVTAVGVLWAKAIHPALNAYYEGRKNTEALLPLMRELVNAFGQERTGALSVLAEIAAQFRTDGGSSLRDVINRLDEASKLNATTADQLVVKVEAKAEADRQMDDLRQQQVERLITVVDRLSVRVDEGLVDIKGEHKSVADDLAAAHDRADQVDVNDPPGSASDAANRTTGGGPDDS